MDYKVVDLFAGAGGLSLGFFQTGRFSIAAAAENNGNARKTYKRNFKSTRLYSDVRTIDYEELKASFGNIDVVIGGPPCQGFSNANRQHSTLISMNNRLVKEYVKAVRELRPKAFVMENVAMLRSNVHRFIVDEQDLHDDIVMALELKEEKLELMPSGIDFPNAMAYAQDFQHMGGYMWDEKKYKVINLLYRFRINRTKFDNAVERYRTDLSSMLEEAADEGEGADDDFRIHERHMADVLLRHMTGEDIPFEDIIAAMEPALFIQRMFGKMKELMDNQIHMIRFCNDHGAVSVVVQSYAVFDYVRGVLGSEQFRYEIHPMLLNAIDYGAPQKRERFIIVGVQPGLTYQEPEAAVDAQHRNTVYDAIKDIENEPVSTNVSAEPVELGTVEHLSVLAGKLRGKLLFNHVITATRATAQARFEALKEGQNFHDLDSRLKSTYSNAERTQNTIYMRLKYQEPCATVVNVRKSMWIHPKLDRAVSIREAARLQTFPDTFIFEGTKDSQYQQVGNAVPPFLAKAIAETIVKALESELEC